MQICQMGYEQYGARDDIGVIEDLMMQDRDYFQIDELRTRDSGIHSKSGRINRLEPHFRQGRFLLPAVAWYPDGGGDCYWNVYTQAKEEADAAAGKPRAGVEQHCLARPSV